MWFVKLHTNYSASSYSLGAYFAWIPINGKQCYAGDVCASVDLVRCLLSIVMVSIIPIL